MKTQTIFKHTLRWMIPIHLFAVSIGFGQENDEVFTLSPFEVSSDRDNGYYSPDTLGGNRIAAEIKDIPLSIISVNKILIEDLAITDIPQALEFVSGMGISTTPRTNTVTIRAQNTQSEYRDGIPESSAIIGHFRVDPIELERLEVIKGPAGVLYGSHSLGGLVNRISKKPSNIDHTKVGGQFGSVHGNNTYAVTTDINRVYGSEGNVRTRLLTKYQEGTSRNGGVDDEYSIIPMVSFVLNEKNNTRIDLRGVYSFFHYVEPRGLWFADPDGQFPFGLVSPDAVVGNPDGDPEVGTQNQIKRLEATYMTSFDMLGTFWNFRLNARYAETDGQFRIYLPRDKSIVNASGEVLYRGTDGGVTTSADGNARLDLRRNVTIAEYESLVASGLASDIVLYPNFITRTRRQKGSTTRFNVDMNSVFETGGVGHKILTYAEYRDADGWNLNQRFDWDAEMQSIFDIESRDPSQVLSNFRNDNAREPGEDVSENFSWAIQDALSVLENKLKLVVGARYDWGEGSSRQGGTGAFSTPETNTDWSFRYGVVYEAADGVSIFGGRSETFFPRGGTNEEGVPFENSDGISYELGVKLYSKDNKFAATASAFEIDLTNQLTSIIRDDLTRITVQEGTATTEGWEVDFFYQPTNQLQLIVGVSDVESTRIIQATGIPAAQRGTQSDLSYSALAKYNFLEGALEGWGLGLGFKHTGTRDGDGNGNFVDPPYDKMNLLASYRKNNWRLNFVIDNLLDKEYVATSINSFLIIPGQGRTLRSTFEYTF